MTRNVKVLITGPSIADEAVALLHERGIQTIFVPPYTDAKELVALVAGEQVDALLVRMCDINEAVIVASERLRVIAKHGVGVNNIDVAAATRRGLPVMITRGANARAVAEHALALLLAVMKNLRPLDAGVREGRWEKPTFKGVEVSGKCLGIVGFGSIGRDLAKLVEPLEMRMLVYDPFLDESDLPTDAQEVEQLDELLSEADVVSLHCPLTDETRGLIGRAELAAMKPSAYLINTARGEVVDEGALVEALRDGGIAGAGLDSFAAEPPATDNRLWALPNVIVTPHIAGVTSESLRRMGVQAVNNILSVLDGREVDISCVVNQEVLGGRG